MDNTLKFTDSHEWVLNHGDGTVTVGISEHAQEMLGDVVYVELPDVDSDVDAGDNFSLVESVKAASDIYSPVSGIIIEVNEDLGDNPELINEEPYEGGWIAKIRMTDPTELDDLKDEEEYLNTLED
ncbi:glycine cleavage system protein GcvH [Vibrio gazogenes]|jgi:glycine cleavage system H protein|uniref:Glycine cleavage system H protein n=1 Tax=Vibrio gazogenes DSM 21264 = NBRC 103151 TaxID=1123492 RepID=A0A1M4VEL8_VIBGA|nr:glycine cleavage system protein GcvH [Vibrio gazogenes]USP15558.1 glycine cleavage system protein GcvH [Vibrio gazogenes]SHE67280.1 glycine cleavage system H protein [Vibrio gazogenes DSM 21264] [Vibrio gazogenes DSM 21264 = NBRC 103151]SJN57069.1 Glycine cleavage system H protein [Vibrio gazogenes]